ncbi:MAG: YdeI/OmpD-associated family protein [Saprospiraceae bacterium]
MPGLWFYNGAFLKDDEKVLVNAQEGKTKGMRQWRFEKGADIPINLVKRYVEEAIQNQKEGKEIKPEKTERKAIPPAFKAHLENNAILKTNFENLTPGKQREYLEYLHEPKQEKTVLNRIDKIIPFILEGKGLNDRYKK